MAAAGGHVPPAGATAPHEHLDAGGSFGVDVSGNRLHAPFAAARDELAGRHANTEIAKVVGAVPGALRTA
ncbi:hypothetical protein [Streptomyces sp. GMR22]|uniref:hypothetical protein n=1 Tax=Streptomyces sp. GMR22 TaxID=2759524 RepID=UPI0015FDBCF0|nr:hypothetical protein [Streptomyces sp. GMR22]MBA6440689.1 hypothetical protein [Streptomyces sp. GMR22]